MCGAESSGEDVRVSVVLPLARGGVVPPRHAPASSAELAEWIAADLLAHGITHWRWTHRLTDRVVHYQRLRRRAEYWRLSSSPWLASTWGAWLAFRTVRLGQVLGFSIPLGTVGPGLRIAHVGTVVVHVDARIGRDCTLSQGVTVGEANGRVARLGDGCHLAPNSVVLGAVLGDRVGVWSGAVVTHDFGDDVSLRGIPARPYA